MFINAQYLTIMRTIKLNIAGLAFLAAILLSSCGTTGYTPRDDVYYSPDDQIAPQRTTVVVKQTKPTDGTVYEGDVESQAEGSYENLTAKPSGDTVYLDDDAYYNIDYASRLRKFSDDNDDDNYFDDGGCTSYSSGSNVSLSFGFGTGFGWGYPYYGWGYPSYGWGYPSYGWGYPYYGWGGSYWSGYNTGYWNGYWDGYYGGGYYPGYPGYPYYPDYGYRNTVQYGPRGGGFGNRGGLTDGSDVPGSGRGSYGNSSPGYRGDRNGNLTASTGKTKARSAGISSSAVNSRQRPKGSVRVNKQNKPQGRTNVQKRQTVHPKQARPQKAVTGRYTKPAATKQHVNSRPVKKSTLNSGTKHYTKPSSKTYVRRQNRTAPRYSKPKAYRSLPSQQPRSSKEYVRPTSKSSQRNYNSRSTVTTPRRETISNKTRNSSRPTMQRRTTTRSSNVRTKSYSSPTRSRHYSAPKTYSAPKRSSGYSGGSSRSYSGSSSSRSSGSTSSSSSRSSSGGGYRGGGRR